MDSKRHFHLLKSIQTACSAPAWSQGAKLAKRKLVEGISASEEEITLRINVPGGGPDPTVVLYPMDDEWECDCFMDDDNCAHVAAAAIAMQDAYEKGESLPVSSHRRAQFEYRFARRSKGLSLSRVIVAPDGASGLVQDSLIQAMQNKSVAFGYRPSTVDLEVDRLLGRALHPQRSLRPDILTKVVAVLAGAPNVYLDGVRVPVSEEPLYPMITVENQGGKDVALIATASPDVEDLVAPGLALCAGTLHEIGEQGLCGRALEKLPRAIVYKREQLAELVLDILPHLEEQGCVTIKSNRLPGVSRFLEPRLVMNMEHAGRSVSVLPELVYGVPPCVRVEGDRLVYLEGTVPKRDKASERTLLEKLRGELNLVPGRKVTFAGRDAGLFMERAQRFGEETLDSSQQILTDVGPLRPVVHVKDDVVDLSFVVGAQGADGEVGGEERVADPLNVLSAWQQGLTMAPLLGGGFATLPTDWLEAHGYLVADILAARNDDNKVATAALPLLAQLCDDLELPRQPCFDRLAPLLEDFESIPQAQLPADLTATLRPYQKQGVDWLCFLRSIRLGAVLADDMGLGKTLQALCAIDGRALVVCPTSVLHNWASEIRRFRPDLSFSVYHGPGRTLSEEATVTLTTYALLRIDVEVLRQEKWDYVILDEAQNIKNPGSMVSRAAFKLDGKLHIAMSGTPVENRLDELWSLFNFVNRGLLGAQSDFQKRYAVPIGFGDTDAAQRLQKRIAPFVLRRLKQNVAPELPPRTDQVLECELDDHERNIYSAIQAATEKEIVQKLSRGGSVIAALEALLRLRQAACHSSLVPGQSSSGSSKVALLLDRLEHTVANEHKALVFSQWTSLLDLVEPHLQAASIDYCRLDGSTKDRGAVVERFQDEAGPPVMLISLKAGGTGLNLTAADHVFLLDPWWNPAVEDQAADRTHRIGQDKPVMVYRLVALGTVEERILDLQEKKRQLAEVALGGADRAVALTREDLLSLLE